MNKFFLLLPFIFAFSGCASRLSPSSQPIVSMQVVDRNGFSETISAQERLRPYQNVDFLKPQPYEKVLRVFKKNQEGKNLSKLTNYHPNGGIWQYLEAVDGRAHGRYFEWHPNGQLKIGATLIEGQADLSESAAQTWLFDGECFVYDREGLLSAHFLYNKGALDREALYYFPNGSLQKKIPYSQGEIHGTVFIYGENGALLEELSFNKGLKEGVSKGFWPNGALQYEETYQSDLLIHASYFSWTNEKLYGIENGAGTKVGFEDKLISTLWEYQKGAAEGKVQMFNKKGILHTLYHLKGGKKQGEEWRYDLETGFPKMLISWDQDLIQGITKTWYPNQQLESQREMTHNQKHGLCLAYYENGDLMLVEEYDNGLLIKGSYYKLGEKEAISTIEGGCGIATLYTSQGHLISKVTYEKSRPLIR